MHKTAAPRLYDTDFALWAEEQAAALRAGRFAHLDADNVAEEIEALAKRDRRELVSRSTVIATHVLKLVHQPEQASKSWLSTIRREAREIKLVLSDSPSLQREMVRFEDIGYERARYEASDETGLPIMTFPLHRTAEFMAMEHAAISTPTNDLDVLRDHAKQIQAVVTGREDG